MVRPVFGKHRPRILRKVYCWQCGDDRQKAVFYWLVIVPADKFLRLLSGRHWNFFLLVVATETKFLRLAFDNFFIVLQIVDLFLQIQIFTRDLFDLGIQILVLVYLPA